MKLVFILASVQHNLGQEALESYFHLKSIGFRVLMVYKWNLSFCFRLKEPRDKLLFSLFSDVRVSIRTFDLWMWNAWYLCVYVCT